jgi:hypothetical protein
VTSRSSGLIDGAAATSSRPTTRPVSKDTATIQPTCRLGAASWRSCVLGSRFVGVVVIADRFDNGVARACAVSCARGTYRHCDTTLPPYHASPDVAFHGPGSCPVDVLDDDVDVGASWLS